jgi:hypothetical protein
MELLMQHALVTAVALGAAGLVVWRIVSQGRREDAAPPCASCPSAKAHATESRTGAAPRG